MTRRGRAWAGTLLAITFCALPLLGQGGGPESGPEGEPVEEATSLRPKLEFGLEAKAHYRRSDEYK